MKELLTKDFDPGDFLGYQKEILTLGLCDFFLPVSFWNREGGVVARYDVTGYRPLGELKRISIGRGLDYIKALTAGLVNSQKLYLFPGQYLVNSDTVYVTEDGKKVKVAFQPAKGSKRDVTVYGAMADAGKYLYAITSEQGKPYINRALKMIKENTFGMENTIKGLNKLSSDVYRFRIEEEGFSFFLERDGQ